MQENRADMILPDGIAVVDGAQNVIVFNEAASRITGFGEDEIIGRNAKMLFRNSPEGFGYLQKTLKLNRNFSNLNIKISVKNGQKKNVLASFTPVKNDGKVISAVFVFRDTREMLLMAEEVEKKNLELINQKNKLDAIFNSNIEGTFTIDNDWEVTAFNRSAEKITGYKAEEAIGKKCWQIFNSSLCRNGCHMEQTMNRGKTTIGNELEIVDRRGKTIPIRVNSSILRNNKGQKCGAVETFIDVSEIKNLSEQLKDKFHYAGIIGKNKELEKVFYLIESVSQTDSTALITGESGTGKELVARSIHLGGARRNGPFVALNCSAFAESLIESELFGHEKGAFTGAISKKTGKFETAQGGTLFLDEVGDISLKVQTKLLRVIETGFFERVGGNEPIELNTRIIAATNKNLKKEIELGNFREDFFYRINVINIHLPPLRSRKDDLLLLANHFILEFNRKFRKKIKQFSSSAFDVLLSYDWPGNIRELENVVEHCFVLTRSDIIQEKDLPKYLLSLRREEPEQTNREQEDDFESAEKEVIEKALRQNNWNRGKTAEQLNIHPTTLWRKMKKSGLLKRF
jgi:PAS domain S-box-containing protein